MLSIMGCCCSAKEKGWTDQHQILVDWMRGDIYMKTVWSEFKRNGEPHGCMEYEEFRTIIRISLEIYDKMQTGYGRQISNDLASHSNQIELAKKGDKFRNQRGDSLQHMTSTELNAITSDSETIEELLNEIAPKLAVQFDKDGDGVFSWDEFKDLALYLVNEYEKLIRGYQAPRIDSTADNASLLTKEDYVL